MRAALVLIGILAAPGVAALAAEGEGEKVRKAENAAATAVETVVNPWVTTDKYVDTSSLDAIVKSIVKEGMTEEQKALAFYHWYRRMLFHHRFMGGDRRDVLKVLNSYGCNLCGSQAAVFVILLQKAGFKTRVVWPDTDKVRHNHPHKGVQRNPRWRDEQARSRRIFAEEMVRHGLGRPSGLG